MQPHSFGKKDETLQYRVQILYRDAFDLKLPKILPLSVPYSLG